VLVVDSTGRDQIEETKDFLNVVIDEVQRNLTSLNIEQVK